MATATATAAGTATAAATTTGTAAMEAPVSTPEYWEELVEYEAPLIGSEGDSGDVFVAVNGEQLRIPRGVPVKVKRKHLEALRLAAQGERDAIRNSNEAQRRGNKPLAEWTPLSRQ